MPFQGVIGQAYTRDEIGVQVGLPVGSKGNWTTGYPNQSGEFFVFTTIGEAGRVEPNYESRWEDGQLIWPTRNDGHLGQESVANLVSNEHTVHVFFRNSNRSRFIYVGRGTAREVVGERPVWVTWSFEQPLANAELRAALVEEGFQLDPPKAHVQKAAKDGLTLYLKWRTPTYPIVIDPIFEGMLPELIGIEGVTRPINDFFYHSSGMTEFPKRFHTGKSPIGFGLAFGIESPNALKELLGHLFKVTAELGKHESGTGRSSKGRQRQVDPKTETESLRAARLGQSRFRADLLEKYNQKCALTEVDMPELLRASHIKPWRDSEDQERLDPENGLLLSVHFDLLFDQGLISFDDEGNIKISSSLSATVRDAYAIREGLRLLSISSGNKPYLKYHRSNVFKP